MLTPKSPDYYAPDRDRHLYAAFLPLVQDGYFDEEGCYVLRHSATELMMSFMEEKFYAEGAHRLPATTLVADDLKHLHEVTSACLAYSQFHAGGRNIFSIDPALADEFDRSDASEVCLDELLLPYRSMYLGFGARENLQNADGSMIDGVYICKTVHKEKPVLEIRLSTYNPKHNYRGPIDLVKERVDELTFAVPILPGKPLAYCMEKARPVEAFRVSTHGPGSERARNIIGSFIEKRAAAGEGDVAALAAALNLTINSICHICSGSDMPPDPDQRQHSPLIDKVPTSRKERHARDHALRRMEENGYSRIRLCREEARPTLNPESVGKGTEMRHHMRKSHNRWIRTPDGEHWRRIEIPQMHIRPDKGPLAYGHIYVTTPEKIPSISQLKTEAPGVPSAGAGAGVTH